MRKLTVNTFLTLDGVMQAPGGPEEDPSDGFRFGGWSAPLWDQGMDEVMGGVMGEPFDLLLGRRTYEIFAAHWPHADERARAGWRRERRRRRGRCGPEQRGASTSRRGPSTGSTGTTRCCSRVTSSRPSPS